MIARMLPLLVAGLFASGGSVAQTPPASPPASPPVSAEVPRNAHQGHDMKLRACMAEADQKHLGGQARKNYVAECAHRQ